MRAFRGMATEGRDKARVGVGAGIRSKLGFAAINITCRKRSFRRVNFDLCICMVTVCKVCANATQSR